MKKLLCVLFAVLMLLAFVACDAETEPVRSNEKETQPVAAQPVEVTEGEIADGDPVIIKVSVYHGNGEITENRLSALKGDSLFDTLMNRVFITEDMNTVDGEYANPELGNSWSLYVDGVFTTETWDQILIDNGVEYTFEYTSEIEFEENIGDGYEEGVEEVPEDEQLGEPDVADPEP